jgi:gamma-glutamyltranspeptidase
MTKFNVSVSQFITVERTFNEDFDTSKKLDWDKLMSRLQSYVDEAEYETFPKKRPNDVNVWMRAYSLIPSSSLDQQDIDRFIDNGGNEVHISVVDSKGNIVFQKKGFE